MKGTIENFQESEQAVAAAIAAALKVNRQALFFRIAVSQRAWGQGAIVAIKSATLPEQPPFLITVNRAVPHYHAFAAGVVGDGEVDLYPLSAMGRAIAAGDRFMSR